MAAMPTLFISHGSPDIAIAETPAAEFLTTLAQSLPRPAAIVVASAHFESSRVLASGDARPETIYDFGGFDPRLYRMRYEAPGEPALAADIVAHLSAAGFDASVATNRGYDHGTWVPLTLAFPKGDIPVVQVSIDPAQGPEHHLRLGAALAYLRERGVLIIGSGSFTHNLREAFTNIRAGRRNVETPAWVSGFVAWMSGRIEAGDRAALADYRRLAPFARENHPTDEHLMPLYVAMGAAGEGARAERLHDSRDFGVLAMEAYAFH
ncbi:DODA-type extradiol aromatic ring-opening family dioxygenase [Mangrovicella endophytica]|uniref:DODA-type extradiol aromatic ring-opening family dioxygenase n=1 Tax=Mangrovicella endophytica TaxID=2066697 RepID=UPI000C9E8968|nr:class III extradiol ring-cleavage dioxygenase [Mangrovicella endophytica]